MLRRSAKTDTCISRLRIRAVPRKTYASGSANALRPTTHACGRSSAQVQAGGAAAEAPDDQRLALGSRFRAPCPRDIRYPPASEL